MPAKKGNKNAVKHGIFAKRIAVVPNIKELDGMKADDNTAELAHARAMLADNSDRRATAKDDEIRLRYDYACQYWTDRIDSLTFRNFSRGQTEMEVFTNLLDAIRAQNVKQKVAR